MAEVLITLAVIGVVAAMTIPMLVSNYQKKVFVTRLQRTYNTLSNAFVSAQVDYGDSSKWDYEGVGVDPTVSDENKILAYNSVVSCIQKYILPYLAKGYTFNPERNKKLADLSYSSDLLYRSGSPMISLSSNVPPYLILNDGTWIFFSYLTFGGQDSDGNEHPYRSYGLRMMVDINGPKPPNTLGRDIYMMYMFFSANSKLIMATPVSINLGTLLITYKNTSREDLLEDCKTSGQYCGALIQRDGWQIKDDYPW